MKLSIVSINHNKYHQSIACMATLWKQYKEEFEANEFEYIVSDNGSKDESLEMLNKETKKYKNFRAYDNGGDVGFGTGCNMGISRAKGEYILLLNDDTLVEDEGISRMLEYLGKHPEIGVLGGKVTNFDGSEQVAVGTFYSLFSFTLFVLGMQRYGFVDKNPSTIREVDWVKGALFMMRKDVFDKVGRFDEHIWMYTEDMELCYRFRTNGYKCVFFPDVSVRHKEHGTSGKKFAIVNIYKNLPYFYKKHKSIFEYWYVHSMFWLKGVILVAIGRLTHNTYFVDTYTEALQTLG